MFQKYGNPYIKIFVMCYSQVQQLCGCTPTFSGNFLTVKQREYIEVCDFSFLYIARPNFSSLLHLHVPHFLLTFLLFKLCGITWMFVVLLLLLFHFLPFYFYRLCIYYIAVLRLRHTLSRIIMNSHSY